ncbi:MAG TPA: hypothetical protein VNF47_27910 [Streptosporangiaceae bacterium]|nr:hypothetical protein [Streptosporangiaceae bacterium]
MVIRLSPECTDLIERQSGVLARWQASGRASDLSGIDALLRRERWQALYRGVYAAHNGPLSRESVLWAAVRRCGPTAALSHFTAAELDRLADRPSDAIHVTIPLLARTRFSESEFCRGLPRVAVYRSSRIDSGARHPARMPPRIRIEETVLDLVELAQDFDAAFSWLSAACNRRLVMPDQIRSAAALRRKMRWRAEVLVALREIGTGVCSSLERKYLLNVERPHRLPQPERQARMELGARSAYLDNLYSEFAVAVELDGRAAHPAEARWQDVHRDNFFARSGLVTLRYNWADVTERPCQVAAEVALTLRMRGWTGTLRSCGPRCQATGP